VLQPSEHVVLEIGVQPGGGLHAADPPPPAEPPVFIVPPVAWSPPVPGDPPAPGEPPVPTAPPPVPAVLNVSPPQAQSSAARPRDHPRKPFMRMPPVRLCHRGRRETTALVAGLATGLLYPAKGLTMADEDVKAELERLRAENARLKEQQQQRAYHMKVSEKGALSLYGLGRFPVTLYKEQWLRVLDMTNEIRTFIRENGSKLKTKGSS
jgi:hypothetical protein